jgi:hypothetical protein
MPRREPSVSLPLIHVTTVTSGVVAACLCVRYASDALLRLVAGIVAIVARDRSRADRALAVLRAILRRSRPRLHAGPGKPGARTASLAAMVSGMTEDSVPTEWTEVNVTPNSGEPQERLLLDVVDPLIHQVLSDRVGDWHYFWEPALRLRIRWLESTHADLDKLTDFLDAAKGDGKIADWSPGKFYDGEAPFYGQEMWGPAYYGDWTSGSELALSIVKHDAANDLSKPRPFHWERRVHLFSNELGLGFFEEACWSLNQAIGYFPRAREVKDLRTSDPEISRLINEIQDKVKELGHAVQRWMREWQTGH